MMQNNSNNAWLEKINQFLRRTWKWITDHIDIAKSGINKSISRLKRSLKDNTGAMKSNISANSKKIKNTAIIALISILAVALGVLAIIYVPKYVHYSKAGKAFEISDYDTAIEQYGKAGTFLHSDEKLKDTYVAYARSCADDGSYDKAIGLLEGSDRTEDVDSIFTDCAKGYIDEERYDDAVNTLKTFPSKTGREELWKACGMGYVQGERYSEAVDAFNQLSDDESVQNSAYSQAKIDIDAKKYESAVKNLEAAQGLYDSSALMQDTYYVWGTSLFPADYTNAEAILSKAGDYKDAKKLINACRLLTAENLLNENKFNEAKDILKQLPSDFSYEGISVSGRLGMLNKASALLNAMGTWRATYNYIESKNTHISTGIWNNWYIDETNPSQTVEIDCKYNGNGAFNLEGKVKFYRFTNYSSLAKYCVESMHTISFKADNITSMPGKFDVGSDATLTFSDGAFRLKYSVRDNYSVNFYNLYNSTVTYGDHKK